MSDGTKTCRTCNVDKALDEFHPDRRRRDGRTSNCIACEANRWRRRCMEVKYGISLEEADALLAAGCAICGAGASGGNKLSIDHCHEARRVRGALCRECNSGLARFADDPGRMRSAADYVEAA